MINNMYALLDRGVGAFRAPLCMVNETMLRRSLEDAFLSEGAKPELQRSEFVRYAEHFDLYLVGTFDDATGVITPAAPVELVLRLSELSNK